MHSPSLPNLSGISSQLAADNSRVVGTLDRLSVQIDQLVDAAVTRDWMEVGRISDAIAREGQAVGYDEVAHTAGKVREAIGTSDSDLEIRRSIVKLIGAYGRIGRN